jgi:hypothetical protein
MAYLFNQNFTAIAALPLSKKKFRTLSIKKNYFYNSKYKSTICIIVIHHYQRQNINH